MGEELEWLRLASHLHMPVDDVRARTSSFQFLQWMAFLEMKEEETSNGFVPIHYYLAQMTAEVRRCWVANKNRGEVKLEHFLLRFRRGETVKPNPASNPADSIVERTSIMKRFLFALTGLNKGTTKGKAKNDVHP